VPTKRCARVGRTQRWLGSSGQWHLTQSTKGPDIAPQSSWRPKTVLVLDFERGLLVGTGKIVKPRGTARPATGRAIVFLVDSIRGSWWRPTVRTGGFLRQLGKPLSRPISSALSHRLSRLPIVENRVNRGRADARRPPTLEIPISPLMPYARLIRTTLFVTTDEKTDALAAIRS